MLLLASAVFAVAALAVPAGAQSSSGDNEPPVLRHTALSEPVVGQTLVVQAVVEDESQVTRVRVWYRPAGSNEYQAAEASRRADDQRLYEAEILLSSAFQDGMEYYIDASDEFGNRGSDGSDAVPYFAEVRTLPALSGLATDSEAAALRPWWKRPWVWVTVVAVVAGGIAIASSRDDETGTVVVE